MRKYFYLLTFSYKLNDHEKSDFDLGVFSTKKNALIKINQVKELTGFNQFGEECYSIIKFAVEFDNTMIIKHNIKLYCLSHEYSSGEDTFWTVFDYFSTFQRAQEKLVFLQQHSRLGKKYPNNFEINAILVDSYNDWSEGFNKAEY